MEDTGSSTDKGALEEERKTLQAKRELADAERRAEQARAKAIRTESKAYAKKLREERRTNRNTPSFSFAALKSMRLFIPLAIVAAIIVGGGGIFTFVSCSSSQPEPTAITTSDLERVVNISRLSSAEFVYNGIAQALDENGSVQYSVAYCATVRAGIDMSEITFEIDEDTRVVTPILPEIDIDEPILDETTLEFMPSNPRADLQEIIALCKEDALTEMQEDGQIYTTARENLQSTVEALITPLLEHGDYTLGWGDNTDSSSSDIESTSENDEGPVTEEDGSDE